MKIEVKYFGMLTDHTGRQTDLLEGDFQTIGDLLDELVVRYPGLGDADFRIAQAMTFVAAEDLLSGGEIALLPPFSGG